MQKKRAHLSASEETVGFDVEVSGDGGDSASCDKLDCRQLDEGKFHLEYLESVLNLLRVDPCCWIGQMG